MSKFYRTQRIREQELAANALAQKVFYATGSVSFQAALQFLTDNPSATYFGIGNERYAAMAASFAAREEQCNESGCTTPKTATSIPPLYMLKLASMQVSMSVANTDLAQ